MVTCSTVISAYLQRKSACAVEMPGYVLNIAQESAISGNWSRLEKTLVTAIGDKQLELAFAITE